MPKKRSIDSGALFPLGALKLAEVLVELAASHKEVAKRLERLLSVTGSGKAYASAIRKQIASLFRKNKFYGYYEARGLAASLDGIRASIINDLGALNPVLTAELLKELLHAANPAMQY